MAEEATPAQEGADDKGLESLEPAKLAKMVRDLRQEAKGHRERAEAAEGKIGTLEAASAKTAERLKALEDSSKTQEQKDKEARKALEEQAALVPTLKRFESYVRSELDAEMKAIEGMKAAEKKLFTDLLSTVPETELDSRLRAIRVLKSVKESADIPKPGNEAHPGEPGGGVNEKSIQQKLAWSPGGTREAQLGGLIPTP